MNVSLDLQLRRPIFLIIWLLFLADSAEVPENDASIIASTAKYSCLMWMPRDGSDSVLVTFESMNFLLDITQIPDTDSVVCGSSCNQDLSGWIESQGVDGITMSILRNQ